VPRSEKELLSTAQREKKKVGKGGGISSQRSFGQKRKSPSSRAREGISEERKGALSDHARLGSTLRKLRKCILTEEKLYI